MFEKTVVDMNSNNRLAQRLFNDLDAVIIKHMKDLNRKGLDRNANGIVSNAIWNLTIANAKRLKDMDLSFTISQLHRMLSFIKGIDPDAKINEDKI